MIQHFDHQCRLTAVSLAGDKQYATPPSQERLHLRQDGITSVERAPPVRFQMQFNVLVEVCYSALARPTRCLPQDSLAFFPFWILPEQRSVARETEKGAGRFGCGHAAAFHTPAANS
jgi:hypothetical protein